MSGRHGQKRKRKPKENAPPSAIHDIKTRPEVAETKPEQAFQQPNEQRPERVVHMKIVSKPDPLNIAIWGLILTAVIALIYYFQLSAMRQSNEINREALESVQRAFIAYHSIECTRGKTGDRIYWSIQPVYENSGNTPALNTVNAYTIIEGKGEITEEMFKVGIPGRIPDKMAPSSIAPKALQPTTPHTLDESYIFGMNLGDRFENFTKLTGDN